MKHRDEAANVVFGLVKVCLQPTKLVLIIVKQMLYPDAYFILKDRITKRPLAVRLSVW